MNFSEILDLLKNTKVVISFEYKGQPPEEPTEEEPATRIVEMTDRCAFFQIGAYNQKGFPIMQNAGLGRTEPPARWQVYAEELRADGGLWLWEIWRGKDNDISKRGYYIRQDKTSVIA